MVSRNRGDGLTPATDERQRLALGRLAEGRGTDEDFRIVNDVLVPLCRSRGCPMVDPGRSRRKIGDCPGWCDLANEHAEAYEARRAAMEARRGEGLPAKPYAPPARARRAYAALQGGSVGAADLLELEKIASACRADGCVRADPRARTKSGVAKCPGWCGVLERAWDLWWSS